MSIFGNEGQAPAASLSPEAKEIFFPGEQTERQEEAAPLSEPDNIENTEENPVSAPSPDNQTSEDAGEEPAQDPSPDEGQEAVAGEENTVPPEVAMLQKNYKELQAAFTRKAQENSTLRKELEAQRATSLSPKEAAKTLLTDPNGYIEQVVMPLKDKVEQLEQEKQHQVAKANFEGAFKECSGAWSELNDNTNNEAIVQEMARLSLEEGDKEAWMKAPKRFLVEACINLWGVPSKPDQAAIEAALKQERENAEKLTAEKNKKYSATITKSANKSEAAPELTEEEKILAGIRDAKTGGLFG